VASACVRGSVGDELGGAPDSSLPAPSTVLTDQSLSDTAGVTTTASTPASAFRWEPLGEPGVGGRVVDLAIDPSDPEHLLIAGDLIGIGWSADGGESWHAATGLQNPEIGRITHHPTRQGEVWAGTMGGPHVSFDGGRTWELRRAGLPTPDPLSYTAPVDRILVDPADPNHLLAFGGSHREWDIAGSAAAFGAVWSSMDAGASWQQISEIADGTNVVDAAWLPDGSLLAAALNGGVWRSADGGTTWAASGQGLSHPGARAFALDRSNPLRVWAALGAYPSPGGEPVPGGVFRSDDGGRSWTEADSGLPRQVGFNGQISHTSRYHAIAVAPSDPNVLLTANQAWGDEGIYRSTDGGNNWVRILGAPGLPTPATAYDTPMSGEALVISPADPKVMLAGNNEFVLRSEDGGSAWADVTSDVTASGAFRGRGYSGLVASRAEFDSDRVVVLCGLDGANPLVSIDGGAEWLRPLDAWDHWGGCIDVARGTTGWWALLGQADIFNGIARFDTPTTTVTASRSVASAPRWTTSVGAAAGLPERGERVRGGMHAIVSIPLPGGGEVVLASVGGSVYRSTDSGSTWTRDPTLAGASDIVVDPAQPTTVYAADDRGVWFSEDAGSTFSMLAGSPADAVRLAVGSDRLYATVWRTGETGLWHGPRRDAEPPLGGWSRLLDEPSAYDVAIDPTDPQRIVLATNDHPYHDLVTSPGLLLSTDQGGTWRQINEGLPVNRVPTVEFHPTRPGEIVVGTFGRGFFSADLSRLAG